MWVNCSPSGSKIRESLKIHILPLFFFFLDFYIIYFKVSLQRCFASTASDKHSFNGTPVKIFVKLPPGQPTMLLSNN